MTAKKDRKAVSVGWKVDFGDGRKSVIGKWVNEKTWPNAVSYEHATLL